MKIIYYSLLLALATVVLSCSEDSSDHKVNSRMVELTTHEILSISYNDAKDCTDDDIFKMVSSFIKAESSGKTRASTSDFKITKKTYINVSSI